MNSKEKASPMVTIDVFSEIDRGKLTDWIGSRFRLQVACLEDPLLVGAFMVKDAIENNRLKPYEIDALKKGEIPELPRMRLIRLLSMRERRKNLQRD